MSRLVWDSSNLKQFFVLLLLVDSLLYIIIIIMLIIIMPTISNAAYRNEWTVVTRTRHVPHNLDLVNRVEMCL